MTDYIDTVHDRTLARAGDEYEDKYAPDWVQDINSFLSNYGLRIVQVLENSAGVAAQVAYENAGFQKYYMTAWQPTEDDLYKLVYETLEYIVEFDEGETMNIFSSALFPYLNGEMIGDSEVPLTIKDVVLEELSNSKTTEEKPVVLFKERRKGWILNKSNAKLLAAELGAETDNWRGARVTLYAPWIEAFGKRMRSVRVKKVLPPTKKNVRKKAVQQAEGAMTDPLFDEEE